VETAGITATGVAGHSSGEKDWQLLALLVFQFYVDFFAPTIRACACGLGPARAPIGANDPNR
jgi:hypothetical protein